MDKSEEKSSLKVIDLSLTKLEIYSDFFIARTSEGVSVNLDMHLKVFSMIEKEFSGNFGMILDEVNSYSIEIEVLNAIRNHPRLACIGVVKYRPFTERSLSIITEIIEKPTAFFDILEESIGWVKSTLHKHREEDNK